MNQTDDLRAMTVPEMNVINAAKALMRSLTYRQREALTGKRRTLHLAVQRLERLEASYRASAVRANLTLSEAGAKTVMDSIEGKTARKPSASMRKLVKAVRARRAS